MDWKRLAAQLKALAHPHRLRIFATLAQCCGEGQSCVAANDTLPCVGDLNRDLGISPSTLSHHIKELVQSGLIETERNGQTVRCWIATATVNSLRYFFDCLPCCGAGANEIFPTPPASKPPKRAAPQQQPRTQRTNRSPRRSKSQPQSTTTHRRRS